MQSRFVKQTLLPPYMQFWHEAMLRNISRKLCREKNWSHFPDIFFIFVRLSTDSQETVYTLKSYTTFFSVFVILKSLFVVGLSTERNMSLRAKGRSIIIIINRTDGHSVIGERKWQTYNAYSHNTGHSKHIWFIINIPLPSSESDSSLGILSKSAKNKMYLKG